MTILEKFGLRPVQLATVRGLKPYSYGIPSESAVGIEVEVENINGSLNLPNHNVWNTVSDGSLRNNGIEFVSRPIRACDAPAALQFLMTEVLNNDCHFSQRTSVHVHLNVQDMEVAQVLDFVLYYALFEKLFYKFAGRGRIKNIYCVPITETALLNNFTELGLSGEWSKYTGLNLVPIRGSARDREEGRAYGTIEFRQMHGTFNLDKLCMWIDLITSLKTFVMKSSTKELRTKLHSMDDNFDFRELLFSMFGEKAHFLKYEGFHEVQDSYMAVKGALLTRKTSERLQQSASADTPFYSFKG